MRVNLFRVSAGALCLIAVAFLVGASAHAQDGGGGGGKGYTAGAFWGTDLDRNEFISKQEARAPTAKGLHEVFEQVDQDGDGLVGYYEFAHFLWNRSYYVELAGKEED